MNKRLKDALLRQKVAATDRMKKQDRHELSVKDRIQVVIFFNSSFVNNPDSVQYCVQFS